LSISSIALSQLNFYGQRLSVAWKIYSLKKVLKCRGNSFVDIDNSKWVVKNRMQNKMFLVGNGDNDIYHCPRRVQKIRALVVKVQGIECQPKTEPVGMTCGLPLYHSQN
jgi:hypothetical protein